MNNNYFSRLALGAARFATFTSIVLNSDEYVVPMTVPQDDTIQRECDVEIQNVVGSVSTPASGLLSGYGK